MDPNAVLGAQPASSGFIDWITQYGNIVAFLAQILYWVAIVVLLAYAVVQYKRWVNYQLGTGRSGKLRTDRATIDADDAPPTVKQPVSIEEFVE
jgi:hypothetical protein